MDLKNGDTPKDPAIIHNDGDRKVIKFTPIFLDYRSRTYKSRGPLIYVIRTNSPVETKVDDPLDVNSYFVKISCLHNKLIASLPHTRIIYKYDNKSVFIALEHVSRNTSMESTVKEFTRSNYDR